MHAWQNRLKSSTAETASGAPPSSPSFVADIGSAILPNPVKGPGWSPKLQRCTLMIQEHVMCPERASGRIT